MNQYNASDVSEQEQSLAIESIVPSFSEVSPSKELTVRSFDDYLFYRGLLDDSLISTVMGEIKGSDIKTLYPHKWLNDQVINVYFKMIERRDPTRVQCCESFFLIDLVAKDYIRLNKWTKNVDIFSKKLMFIPLHLEVHWSLAVINFDAETITYYDSMNGNNEECLQIILEYLKYEHLNKKKIPLNTSNWKKIHAKNIPQQDNGDDCGVFACSYAELLSRNEELNFSSKKIVDKRFAMMEEITTGQLYPSTINITEQKRAPSAKKTTSKAVLNHNSKIPTDIPGGYVYQSASFHQESTKIFNHDYANAQCTAISTYAIVRLCLQNKDIDVNWLNSILIEGDRYYLECKNIKDITYNHLGTEDLLTRIEVDGINVDINIEDIYSNTYSDNCLEKNLIDFLEKLIKRSAPTLNNHGFIFIGDNRTVAFKIVVGSDSRKYGFLLFNSHSIDLNNKPAPLDLVLARLFYCETSAALATLLTKHVWQKKSWFTIHRIELISK
ncbi:uncharacterized protein LOC123265215 [Cotesia glomerata]|uniref:uncharacterized protein LOC123265215 n=1 Tax=Cotesia glomerata TaxID=32391 RepID=UPI001D015D13|nr:uncharacterized protein LOC123265215 [Cotesia glomerata]